MKVIDNKYDCKFKTVSVVLLIAAFSQSSCKDNRKREDAAKIVKEWTGKETYKRIINERETKVLTMEKGGEFTSLLETTHPPRFPLKRKEAAKVRN